MSDLISRQDATSIPVLPKEHRKQFKNVDEAFETGWNEALSCVNMLPSADRPTGKWEIKTETDEYGLKRPKLVCSKCKKEPVEWDLTELFDFCPNCGTKMEGDTE